MGGMVMMNKNSIKANKYNKSNTKQYCVRLNLRTDRQLIEYMESKTNKQGYIKDLIRNDMIYSERIKFNAKSC